MLNADQLANLRTRSEAVASSVHRAWMHYQILRGLQSAASRDQESLLTHPHAFDAIYRAVFDALYVVVGQVTDTSKHSESLHTLVKMARGYPVQRSVIRELEQILLTTQPRDGSPLHRLHRWRNQHTAHLTLAASTPQFYEENHLRLEEIERAIHVLDIALSDITEELLGHRYDLRQSTEAVFMSCDALLARYAN